MIYKQHWITASCVQRDQPVTANRQLVARRSSGCETSGPHQQKGLSPVYTVSLEMYIT